MEIVSSVFSALVSIAFAFCEIEELNKIIIELISILLKLLLGITLLSNWCNIKKNLSDKVQDVRFYHATIVQVIMKRHTDANWKKKSERWNESFVFSYLNHFPN